MTDAETAPKPTRTPFPRTFYVANVMEIFERMAWYGFFSLGTLYMSTPLKDGGLGLESGRIGVLMGLIPFLLYLFPVITGALADRMGFRKTFLLAFTILTPSYFLLGQFKSFSGFALAFLAVAVGSAFFKPVVAGTVSRTTDETNKSLGFGIFYTIVNVGGFIGPMIAGYFRAMSWDWVFIMSATWIGINFIPTIFVYRDPPRVSGEDDGKKGILGALDDAKEVLGNGRLALTVVPVIVALNLASGGFVEAFTWPVALYSILGWLVLNFGWDMLLGKGDDGSRPWHLQRQKVGDGPFVLYLLILAGFWASFYQVWVVLPQYIRDFVDTGDLVNFFAMFGDGFVNFFAGVNVESLAEKIVGLSTEHPSAFGVGEESKKIFFELVHSKVRVPQEVIASEFSQLASVSDKQVAAKALAEKWVSEYRQVGGEHIVNIDALAIVLFQILISLTVQRWRIFSVLVLGTIVCGVGLAMNSIVASGFMAAFAVFVFAVGEMIASPKSQEYVSRIAHPDKAAMFMGYYFMSTAIGNLAGGLMAGQYDYFAKEIENTSLMWLMFGSISFASAAGLFLFKTFVVPKIEAKNRAESQSQD